MTRLLRAYTALLVVAWSLSSCSGGVDNTVTPPGGGTPVAASISVSLNVASPVVGDTVTATAVVRDATGAVMSGTAVTWSMSDASIATPVTANRFLVRAAGTTQVVATSGIVSGSATMTAAMPAPAPVASVTVTLSSAAVTSGATTQATATLRDASGNVLTGRPVTWSSDNAAVATVSGTGVVSAVGVGTAHISATSESKIGSATLAVTATSPAPVATVAVALDASALTVGGTTQATATLRDAANNVLTGRSIAWTSDNTAIATVSAAGLVTAVAAGTAHITATSETKSGSATLTVTAVAPSAAECASAPAAWIWCDDFESDRTSRYFEYDNAGGTFVRAAAVGKDGSMGMRVHFAAAQQNAGSLKIAFGKTPNTSFKAVDAGTAIYREIYWRMYLRNQAGWTGGGGDKLSRATSLVNPSWAQAMIAHVWSGDGTATNYLAVEPVSGTDTQGVLQTTTYNDFANFRWLGNVPSTTPTFDAAHVGQWHCIEAHAKLNDPGASNGLEEIWIDGVAQAAHTGLNFLGGYSAFGINAVFFESYWNAGSPVAQERYFDNLVVSTQRIGC